MTHKLVYYGNETLAKVAQPVERFDSALEDLIDDMFNIMYSENGIGLAAPQININQRIIVFDVSHTEKKNGKLALINPVIVSHSTEEGEYEEGCLSLPGLYEEVTRPLSIVVKALTPKGKSVKIEADGLLARVLQHEIDHLEGILFIDRIEDYRRKTHLRELKKIKKLNSDN